MLFKVLATPERRHEIIEIANVFRAKVVDVGKNTLTVEATGIPTKLDAMENLFRAYGIRQLTRTGKIAMARATRVRAYRPARGATVPRAPTSAPPAEPATACIRQSTNIPKEKDDMAVTIYYENDCDPEIIQGKKVAVIGYGSQGHAHALNLMDSGCDVRVGLREGSASAKKAHEAGLKVMDMDTAAKEANVIMMPHPRRDPARRLQGVCGAQPGGR